MSAASPSIAGAFNAPQIQIAKGLAGRLLFNPGRLGSQFYPTIGEIEIQRLLMRSVKAARDGIAHLSNDEKAGLTSFATTIDAGKKIGFDAYRPAAVKDDGANMADGLPLGPLAKSPFASQITAVAEAETDDDLYDPFFTFLVASRLQALYTVERVVEKPGPPIITLIDAEVTSRPLPQFVIEREVQASGPMLLLGTPAQRLMLRDLLMGPKSKFRDMSLKKVPTLSLPAQPHPSRVIKSIAAALALGGGKG